VREISEQIDAFGAVLKVRHRTDRPERSTWGHMFHSETLGWSVFDARTAPDMTAPIRSRFLLGSLQHQRSNRAQQHKATIVAGVSSAGDAPHSPFTAACPHGGLEHRGQCDDDAHPLQRRCPADTPLNASASTAANRKTRLAARRSRRFTPAASMMPAGGNIGAP